VQPNWAKKRCLFTFLLLNSVVQQMSCNKHSCISFSSCYMLKHKTALQYLRMRISAHTHPFNGPLSTLPGWASTRKVKPMWILLKQETVSGSGISWAICKSAPCSRQITIPAPQHSVFYRPDALPATQPAVAKHWMPDQCMKCNTITQNMLYQVLCTPWGRKERTSFLLCASVLMLDRTTTTTTTI